MTYWARAIGAARSGNMTQAKRELGELDKVRRDLIAQKKKAYAEAVGDDRKEAEAWLLHGESKNDEAVATLTRLAEKEEAEGDEPMSVPAREMLGDMLMEMKRPAEALAAYQMDLKFNPKRFNGLYGAGQAAEAAGKANAATQYYAELVKVCAGSSSERPELTRAKGLVAKK
jgi:tetratricopeptide (TPR) repeat protein